MTNSNEFGSFENLLVLITGASRGIGKELARQLAIHFMTKKIHFFLLARNKEQLEKTKEIVKKCSSLAKVESVVANLSAQPFDVAEKIAEKIKILNNEINFDGCLIVHNAGTLGDLTKKSSELNDQIQWHEYLQTNLISTIYLNNTIFDAFQNCKKDIKLFIVNITSLLSVKAYPSFTQYSVGKAAREAYFRAFSAEHPKCRVLNYSPGPVDTDMHLEVCQKTYDQGVRQVFSTQRHNANLHRKLLTPEETVKRLILLIDENKFENGARVDYFDK